MLADDDHRAARRPGRARRQQAGLVTVGVHDVGAGGEPRSRHEVAAHGRAAPDSRPATTVRASAQPNRCGGARVGDDDHVGAAARAGRGPARPTWVPMPPVLRPTSRSDPHRASPPQPATSSRAALSRSLRPALPPVERRRRAPRSTHARPRTDGDHAEHVGSALREHDGTGRPRRRRRRRRRRPSERRRPLDRRRRPRPPAPRPAARPAARVIPRLLPTPSATSMPRRSGPAEQHHERPEAGHEPAGGDPRVRRGPAGRARRAPGSAARPGRTRSARVRTPPGRAASRPGPRPRRGRATGVEPVKKAPTGTADRDEHPGAQPHGQRHHPRRPGQRSARTARHRRRRVAGGRRRRARRRARRRSTLPGRQRREGGRRHRHGQHGVRQQVDGLDVLVDVERAGARRGCAASQTVDQHRDLLGDQREQTRPRQRPAPAGRRPSGNRQVGRSRTPGAHRPGRAAAG